ncbi:MAG: NAD(P)/FAD-dependent oxidoreductase [Methanomicrobiales archaeon HGW-Methanomicrobiales-1]|nr:MAG: NAD(P)/FAD-dependent oxidoreductase [Methanomicrobiales archaeon HGW-Methanomicrobiales-1]
MIVVLGGGPAGRIASIRLASAGKEVRLIEGGGIGGQCLHFGCMPVCALNDVARTVHSIQKFQHLGVMDSSPGVNFPRMLEEMHAIQAKIASVLDEETKSAGVDIIYGKTGRLEGKAVFLDDEKIEADTIIAATGSRPRIPAIPGIDLPKVYTPHTLFTIKKIPERLSIIGGGVMAAEFAYIFSTFGSKVTLLCRSTLLKEIDTHLRALAVKDLSSVDIQENTQVQSINERSGAKTLTLATGGKTTTLETDAVLIAAGLVPRSEMLNGINKGPVGEIIVDERMRTSVPDVYACGDVIGPPYLTPVARHQGIVAADNILGIPRTMDYRFIPQSINLSQELAFCSSVTENTASLAIPGPAGPGTFWSVPSGDTGLAKIFVNRKDGAIDGVCAAGPGGGLIAGYMAFLMSRHFSVHDFEDFIEVHPSTDGVYGLAKYASGKLKTRKGE